MVTSEDLAAFLVKTAAAVVRLDLTLGSEDERFRQLAISDMVDGVSLPRPLEGLREELLAGADPVAALSHAFSRQAHAYCEGAARATVTVVEQAVTHVHAAGGDAAVEAFLDDLQHQNEEPAAL
ncbi:hypothetical protein [Terrabacter sp. BE26]|uniref:hypothetical protein n=1 Tax=Terrabacter sp. BE26 TaxID=2898152 RepID=UPI0035BE2E92